MKIIDILNKIAKGEEVPETIKYCEYIFKWTGLNYYVHDCDRFLDSYICLEDLNYPVEIIEEKEIEKLNLDTDELRGKETVRAIDYLLEGKINEIIDVINDMRDKEC